MRALRLPTNAGFQSTPPVWAETLPMPGKLPLTKHFNPLRPCGRRPFHCDHPFCITNFNPLRPCGRRPENEIFSRQLPHFNPLRPCGRRPERRFKQWEYQNKIFQSTPPVWAETVQLNSTCSREYFNPLRPCGRRLIPHYITYLREYFNPLRPCGRRLVLSTIPPVKLLYFNPLRPCGRRLFYIIIN